MHVDRVGVIDDVLPAADDVLPLGHEGAEQPDVVHHHQAAHDAVAVVEDAQEAGAPGWVAANCVGDQVLVLAYLGGVRGLERVERQLVAGQSYNFV